MWEVKAEGTSNELYGLLKREFDEEYVPKEEYEFTTQHPRRGSETHKKLRAVPDEERSVQFRRALKSAQAWFRDKPGTLRVTLRGGDDGFSVNVEEVSA